MKPEQRCSYSFSDICLTEKIMSAQDLPLRNPHCVSGRMSSASRCNLVWTRPATAFPTTSRRAMPLQLSQLDRFPFFGIGTSWQSTHSWGTRSAFHTVWTRSSSAIMRPSPPAFSSSGKIPEPPAAFPFRSRSTACLSSSRVGGSARSSHTSCCSMVATVAGSYEVGT